MSDHSSNGIVQNLILVRLLATGKKGQTPSQMKKALGPVLRQIVTEADIAEVVEDATTALTEAAKLQQVRGTRTAVCLTEDGRKKAYAYLGVESLPATIRWDTLKNTYLVARALGVSLRTPKEKEKFQQKGRLEALVLKNRLNLALAEFPTLPQAFGALVGARRSGIPGLREALLERMIREEGSEGPVAAPAIDLKAFADTVLKIARECTSGRFGPDKVFISHVWRQFRRSCPEYEMTEQAFKKHLADANREDLLALSQADLVEAMDPRDVSESETVYLNARFHFVRTDRST